MIPKRKLKPLLEFKATATIGFSVDQLQGIRILTDSDQAVRSSYNSPPKHFNRHERVGSRLSDFAAGIAALLYSGGSGQNLLAENWRKEIVENRVCHLRI